MRLRGVGENSELLDAVRPEWHSFARAKMRNDYFNFPGESYASGFFKNEPDDFPHICFDSLMYFRDFIDPAVELHVTEISTPCQRN
jgi:hypothetical protein